MLLFKQNLSIKLAGEKMKTPLNFQVSEFDCGTVSAINVINYLFAREEIPAALLQGIYHYTLDRLSPKGTPGEGGTSKQAMALLANWLNEYSTSHHFPLKCRYYQGELVQETLLQNILHQNGVAIVRLYLLDTQHYALITKKNAELYYLFDPYYLDENYTNPKAKIIFDQLFAYNRQVKGERLFSLGTSDFAMGKLSNRELIACWRKTKCK